MKRILHYGKLFILIMLLLIITPLTGCSGIMSCTQEKTSPEIVLRYAEVNPSEHLITQEGVMFAEKVKELSGGRIEVVVYDSGQLGDDRLYYQQMQMGALDMYRGNTIALSDINDMKAGVLALPYLFRDKDHFWKVCNSELGREILDDVQKSGSQMVGLCYLDEGSRNIMTVNEPVSDIDKLYGKTIRSMVGKTPEDTLKLLGANPVAMGYSDLYSALASKTIDGAENPMSSYYYNQFYKVAPYYTLSNHSFAPSIMLMSEITWEHLSEEDRKCIREAAEMVQLSNREDLAKVEQEIYDKLVSEGVTIVEPDNISEWEAATKSLYDDKREGYAEVINKIREMGTE